MPNPQRLPIRFVAVITGAFALPGAGASAKLVTASYHHEITRDVAGQDEAVGPPGGPGEGLPPVAAPAGDLVAAPREASEAAPSDDEKLEIGGGSDDASASPEPASGGDSVSPVPPAARANVSCLARTVCEIKQKIRWQTAAWSPGQCQKIAHAVEDASARYNLSPSLLLAVMINESDMNERAARVYLKDNKVYAKDGGLMALRCVLDRRDRCVNSNLRGVKWTELMDPATNIALGARELARWRDGGAYVRKTVKVRDAAGRVHPVMRNVPCRHTDHGFWAHYNHGPRYIDHGPPRHYPHRVAVLDHSLASVLNTPAPELQQARITVRDPGRPQRTADHPMEARYKKLCSQIESVRACSAVAMN